MANTVASLGIDVTARTAAFEKGLKQAENRTKSFASGISGLGAGLTASIASFVSAGAALSAIKFSVGLAADAETTATSFRILVGDIEKANELLAGLRKFGAETPFEFPELADAGKKLLAFGFDSRSVLDNLRRLGDVASGLNIPIGELAEIYGKARVQGRLFAEDVNQLTGRGIPVIQEFAKQFGVTESEVRKLVETGKIGFENLERAFIDLTSEGGKFSGMMEEQSKTLSGMLSTFRDDLKMSATEFGQLVVTGFDLKDALKETSAIAADFNKGLQAAAPEMKESFEGIRTTIAGIATEFTGATDRAEAFRQSLVTVANAAEGIVWMLGKIIEFNNMLPTGQLMKNLTTMQGGSKWEGADWSIRQPEQPTPTTRPAIAPTPPASPAMTPRFNYAEIAAKAADSAASTVGKMKDPAEEARKKAADASRDMWEEMRADAKAIRMENPLERFRDELTKLTQLRMAGLISAGDFARKRGELFSATRDELDKDKPEFRNAQAIEAGSAEAFSALVGAMNRNREIEETKRTNKLLEDIARRLSVPRIVEAF